MEYTSNYQLPIWAESDRILMDDFNDMTGALEDALTDHGEKLAWLGNCRIETGTYVGTGEKGEEHPNSITCTGKPIAILVGGGSPNTFFALRGIYDYVYILGITISNQMCVSWGENNVTWYTTTSSDHQCNTVGKTHSYVVLMEQA